MEMKKKIAETLLLLSKKKNIDKITVKDLVDNCSISRQTFYYHFQDIQAVLEWITEQAVNEALQHSVILENPEEAMKKYIEVVIEHKDVLKNLLNSEKYESVEIIFIRSIEDYLKKYIVKQKLDVNFRLNDIETTLCYTAFGICGVLMKYTKQGKTDVDALAKQLTQLIKACFLTVAEE